MYNSRISCELCLLYMFHGLTSELCLIYGTKQYHFSTHEYLSGYDLYWSKRVWDLLKCT